jgi:hypothetical protein
VCGLGRDASLVSDWLLSPSLPPPPPPPSLLLLLPPLLLLRSLLQNDFLAGQLVALGYLTFSALVIAAAIGSVYFSHLGQDQIGESIYIFSLIISILDAACLL